MLIYRVETCISLVGENNYNAGEGPYGGRTSIMAQLHPMKEQELIKYLRSTNYFKFHHNECDPESHPAPTSDPELMDSLTKSESRSSIRDYIFGFKSLEQLKKWFDEEALKRLHSANYYVSIYETEEYHVGSTQCIFKRESAKLVNFISCIEA